MNKTTPARPDMPDAYYHECRYGDEIFISKDSAESRKSMCGGEIIPLYRRADSPSPATVEKMAEALWSIAGSTCCGTCQEAKLVAQKALAAHEAEGEK